MESKKAGFELAQKTSSTILTVNIYSKLLTDVDWPNSFSTQSEKGKHKSYNSLKGSINLQT